MSELSSYVTLTRDVVAILIPAGTKVELPEGASAEITQALGGSFTVHVQGHLFRIHGTDADALGREVINGPDVAPDASDEEIEKAVWAQLRTCYDPEIPIDIVELGLVYECKLEHLETGSRKAVVRMTLTAPGCGMGDVLVSDVKTKVLQVPSVSEADVELTFDPPWTKDMMSEAAQLQDGHVLMSDTITRGVRISVAPQYVPEQSQPDRSQYFFAYHITIQNQGSSPVQLISRHWIITDGEGKTEEVRGPGVVGHQPMLKPGEAFRYSSGCPMTTPVGTMHGSFHMVPEQGEPFEAAIEPFRLAVPRMLN